MGKPVSKSKVKRRKDGKLEYAGYTFEGYNKPRKSRAKNKKKVVLAKKGGQVKLVHFGDSRYRHNVPGKRKESYLKRSAGIKDKAGKATKGDPFSANYWARKVLWPKKK